MKQHAVNVAELRTASERLKEDIARLEEDLAHTGTIQTADDVQEKLGELASEM